MFSQGLWLPWYPAAFINGTDADNYAVPIYDITKEAAWSFMNAGS